MHSAWWLVRHDTVRSPSHCCLSVWYFYLQLLLCRSSHVGCGGNSAGVLCLESLCYAVEGKICHTLWTQFAAQPKVKFHKLLWLSYAVSGKNPHTELEKCKAEQLARLSHAAFAVSSHRQRFKTLMGLLYTQNYDCCWDQGICQSS